MKVKEKMCNLSIASDIFLYLFTLLKQWIEIHYVFLYALNREGCKVYKCMNESKQELYEKGYKYSFDPKTRHNYRLARDCFEESGTPESLYSLGLIYIRGLGIKVNYKLAIDYFKKSRTKESVLALGTLYLQGRGVIKDHKKAKQYFEYAKEFTKARIYLGVMYILGLGVKTDYRIAYKYLCSVCRENIELGYSLVGSLYYYGLGTTRNYIKAQKLFESSSNEENSIYMQGLLYYKGLARKKDYKKAMEFFLLVANDLEHARHYLGEMYYKGIYVEKDINEALNYFEKSCSIKESVEILHKEYLLGKNVPQNKIKARAYFRKLPKYSKEDNFLNYTCEKFIEIMD